MLDMRNDLFRVLSTMTERVRSDAALFEVDPDAYLRAVWTDVEALARRIGLEDSPPGPGAAVPDAGPPQAAARQTRPATLLNW